MKVVSFLKGVIDQLGYWEIDLGGLHQQQMHFMVISWQFNHVLAH